MKKFLFVFLTIVILLIGGFVFFATQTLNADNFQHQIKQTVQELTGRELTIKGGTQLNWRPMPTITLTDVSLSNIAESEYKNMVQAEKISVEIEWTSIFSSPFKIKNIVMKNPIFVLERNEYNKVNWRFPFLSGQDKLNDTFNTIIANPDAKDTQIESIKIQNGVLHYINEVNNLSLNVENINGQLAVQSLTGPYHFQGDISCLKNNFGLAVQVEEIKNDVPAKFTAKLSEQKSDFLVKLEGTQTPHLSSSIVNIIGDFQLQKPNTFLTLLGLPMMPEAANQPTVGNFSMEHTSLKDHLKNLTFRIGEGDNALSAHLNIEFIKKNAQTSESYNGSVAINKLDYSLWKPLLSRLNWDFIGGEKQIPQTTLQLNIPIIVFNQKDITDFETKFTYNKGQLKIARGKAVLPGEGNTLTFSGETQSDAGGPQLTLDIKSQINQAAEVKALLNQPMIPDAIQTANFKGQLLIQPTAFSAKLNEFELDNQTEITGTVSYQFKDTPALAADLFIDFLTIDTYFPQMHRKEAVNLLALPTVLEQEMSKYPALEKSNVAFDVQGTHIKWGELPINELDLKGNLANGQLSVENFELKEVATANLKLAGNVSGFGTMPFALNDINIDLNAKNFNSFMSKALLGTEYPLINHAKKAQIQLAVSGSNNQWQIKSDTKFDETQLKLDGNMTTNQDVIQCENCQFSIYAPQFRAFLTAMNLPNDTFKKLDGNFNVSGLFNGTNEEFALQNFLFSVGTERLTGTLDVKRGSILTVKGDLTTSLLNADRYLPTITLKQNGQWNKNTIHFESLNDYNLDFKIKANEFNYGFLTLQDTLLDFTMQDKNLTLTNFSGKQKNANNSLVSINGQLNWLDIPTLKTQLDIQRTPLRSNFLKINTLFIGDGTATLKGELQTKGNSITDMIQNLTGSGQFELDNNVVVGMNLPQMQEIVKQSLVDRYTTDVLVNQLKQSLASGKTSIVHGNGKWEMTNGVAQAPNTSIQTEVSHSNPTQITWDLPQQNLKVYLPIKLDAYELPDIVVNLNKMGTQSSYSFDMNSFQQILSRQIMHELERTDLEKTQQENLKKEAVVQNRTEKVMQAVADAESAVKRAEQLAMKTPSERATLLLQNAKDALYFVKTLMVKEQLTESQYQQLIEQARLAVLRAQEAENEILKNDLLETRRNILALSQYGEAVVKQMQDLHERRPYIEIIPTIITQAQEEIAKINACADRLIETTDVEQINLAISDANTAFQKVQELYNSIKRFDTSVPQTETDQTNSVVRGSFSRKQTVQ